MGKCSSELDKLFSYPNSYGRSIRHSCRFYDFLGTIPRCYKDVYINSFFLHTAGLWNVLPA